MRYFSAIAFFKLTSSIEDDPSAALILIYKLLIWSFLVLNAMFNLLISSYIY